VKTLVHYNLHLKALHPTFNVISHLGARQSTHCGGPA